MNYTDTVNGFSAANYAIGTLIMRFESDVKLQNVMAELDDYIKVVLK